MKQWAVLLTWIGILGCGMIAVSAEPPAAIKVLLLTGDDVAPFHDWRENSEATREVLVSTEKFDVKVCEDPMILESKTAIERYDVIVFTLYATKATPMISDQAQENLLNFVKNGKGFVVTHLASASFADWEEFGKLCGRKWVMGTSGHSARDVFKAKIVDKDNPITKGLEDFQTFDELYSKLQGDAEIHVLVTGDSAWSKQTEPLAFTLSYGKGRVYHWAFGHDRKAIMNPSSKKLLIRGCEWAATGKVSD
jgi:uncharacterized protein